MSIYGILLNEGFFNNRSKLKESETIINTFCSSIKKNEKIFFRVTLSTDSFKKFKQSKQNFFKFYFYISEEVEIKIRDQLFKEYAKEFESKKVYLEKELQDKFSEFKISVKINISEMTLRINCIEK